MHIMTSNGTPYLLGASLMFLLLLFVAVHRSNGRAAMADAAWNARAAARQESASGVYTYRANLHTISTVPGRVSGNIHSLKLGVESAEAVAEDWSPVGAFTLDYMREAVQHVLLSVERVHIERMAALSPTPLCLVEWIVDGGPMRLVPPVTYPVAS